MIKVRDFFVHLSSLEGGAGEKRALKSTGHLEAVANSDVIVRDDAHIVFDGAVEWLLEDRFALTGIVTAPWEGVCRRCLGPAAGVVNAQVREVFEPNPTEGESYEVKGDNLDYEPMVRDVVALELPLAPLCKDDCAGLCPVCGINKNEATCECDTAVIDPRWAALEDIKAELDS